MEKSETGETIGLNFKRIFKYSIKIIGVIGIGFGIWTGFKKAVEKNTVITDQGGNVTVNLPPAEKGPPVTLKPTKINKENPKSNINSNATPNQFIEKFDYVNPIEQKKDIAIFIVDGDQQVMGTLAAQIGELYKEKNHTVTESLFKYGFVKSSYLARLENGDSDIIEKLKLPDYVKYIVIGRYSSSIENGEYTKYIDRGQLEIAVISCVEKTQVDAFRIIAANGYDDKDHAEKGMLEKLVDDYRANHLNL